MFILEQNDKISPEEIDKIISAEIPDIKVNPKAYKTVCNSLLHGPCGPDFPDASCMENGKCSKGFPKPFSETTVESNDGYPVYRRRDDGKEITKATKNNRKFTFKNDRVVPHNLYLTAKYDCHINVEICSSVAAVKYLYKYIYKGHDKAAFTIQSTNGVQTAEGPVNTDEIGEYLAARYVSAIESVWRIFHYPLHGQYPNTVRLQIHTENNHTVTYKEGETMENILTAQSDTKLMAYFKLNQTDEKARDLLFHEIPKWYTWKQKDKKWKRRTIKKEAKTIGRMYYVNPKDIERFSLRTLLLHRKGATCFEDLKKVDGYDDPFPTFKGAASALGLLASDDEWNQCLQEATSFQSEYQLRDLFVHILVNCVPTNEGDIWEKNKNDLCRDILYRKRQSENNNTLDFDDTIYAQGLYLINTLLRRQGKSLDDYPLIPAYELTRSQIEQMSRSSIERQELDYNTNELEEYVNNNVLMMNSDQKIAYEKIIKSLEDCSKSNHFYIVINN